jgi:hypothetical protein
MSSDKEKEPTAAEVASHDEHPASTDIIPESSLQDMALKVVTVAAFVLVNFAFMGWWFTLDLSQAGAGHGGAETTEH